MAKSVDGADQSYADTRRRFDRATAAYSTDCLFAAGEDLAWLQAAAEPRPQDAVLDLATGAGHAAFALAPWVAEVVGIDITPAMVAAARDNARQRGLDNVRFMTANAERLPFPEAVFDIVTCRYAAHHFRRPQLVVNEVARVLRPGGRFIVIDPTAPEDVELDQWLDTIERLRDPSHVRDWSQAEWQRLMIDAGLCFETLHTWMLPLEVEAWLARQQTPATAADQIRAMLRAAGAKHRRAFQIGSSSFALLTRLMRGKKQALPQDTA